MWVSPRHQSVRRWIRSCSLITLLVNYIVLNSAVSVTNSEAGEMAHSASNPSWSKVDLSDGVSKQEAIILAKDHLRQIDAAKNCILSLPRVKKSKFLSDGWQVIFWPKPSVIWRLPFTFSVEIDRRTGEIKSVGWDH